MALPLPQSQHPITHLNPFDSTFKMEFNSAHSYIPLVTSQVEVPSSLS